MKGQANPFIISGYEGAEYFCDRVAETADDHLIVSGRNKGFVQFFKPTHSE